MRRIFGVLCLLSVLSPSYALYGLHDSSDLGVNETVTADGNNTWLYTFDFANFSAPNPIYWFGAYVGTNSGAIGANTASYGSGGFNVSSTGVFGESGYLSSDATASVYNIPETSSDVAAGGTGSFSFTANVDDTGPTVFWAEIETESLGATGTDGSYYVSYVGSVTPNTTPEPGLMAAIGMAGLGTAFARRRRRVA